MFNVTWNLNVPRNHSCNEKVNQQLGREKIAKKLAAKQPKC